MLLVLYITIMSGRAVVAPGGGRRAHITAGKNKISTVEIILYTTQAPARCNVCKMGENVALSRPTWATAWETSTKHNFATQAKTLSQLMQALKNL